MRNVICRLTITHDWEILRSEEVLYEALDDSTNSLLMLKDHNDLTIEVYLNQDIQFSRTFCHVLETIRPVYLSLREANIDIKALSYEFFKPIGDDVSDTTSEQLNYYFTSKPKEWLEMKAEDIKAIPQVQLRRRCKRVSVQCSETNFELTWYVDIEDHARESSRCQHCYLSYEASKRRVTLQR
jgi:hypothetical protein